MRYSTGVSAIDDALGGGLLPGTLTVVMGATGIGKTQLGLQFAQAGARHEGEAGILFDLTSRGDAQNQNAYAQRMFDWTLREFPSEIDPDLDLIWDRGHARSDYCHLFQRGGRRVTRRDLETEDWHDWRQEFQRKLERAIAFFYGNFVHGVRRCVIDGIEPTDRSSESFQFHVFNYVYHQILHKDADWTARDLFRIRYREFELRVAASMYDHRQLACLLLHTSREVMLDDLIEKPLETGDELSNANTIILMGKTRDGGKMGRGLYVAKHRGSTLRDEILNYRITDSGLVID